MPAAVCAQNTYVAWVPVRLSQQSTGVRAGGEGRHTTCPGRALMTQGEKGKPKKVQTDGVMSDSTQTRELERSRR